MTAEVAYAALTIALGVLAAAAALAGASKPTPQRVPVRRDDKRRR